MSLHHFENSLKYFSYSGTSLSHEQCVLLFNSLTCLQHDNHFHEVFFWGQIWGIEKDYFIAYGYVKDAVKGRIYFYSTDCITWGILPKSTPEVCVLSLSCTAMFQGDPAYVIDLSSQLANMKNDQEKEGPIAAEDVALGLDPSAEPPPPPPVTPVQEERRGEGVGQDPAPTDPGNLDDAELSLHVKTIKEGELKEEDRLASVVDMIVEESSLVPKNALLKRTDGSVVINTQFSGMTLADSEIISNFFHFRVPLYKWNTNLLSNPAKDYNYSVDFLDTIDRDMPYGQCWSRQYVRGSSIVLMRNLYWQGNLFYHCLDTPDYGNWYVGFGRREIDFPFMYNALLK